jgi:hypothetical protein
VEERVERLRKPEGAAQLELVASAWVADRYLIRWRATKPHGRVVGKRQASASSGVSVGRESASESGSCFVREVNDTRARPEHFGVMVGGNLMKTARRRIPSKESKRVAGAPNQ